MVISHIISAQREMSKTGDPVEKGSHTIHDVGLIEFAGAVAAAVENVVFGVHTVLGQQLVKPLALRDGNQWVGAAVDDEKRRRAAADIPDGAGARRGSGGRVRAQKRGNGPVRKRAGAGDARRVLQIGQPVKVDDALYRAALLRPVAPVEFGDPGRDAAETGERAARGFAHEKDAGRVDAVFLRVRAQEADGGLHILQRGGEGGFVARAVFHAGDGIARAGERHQLRQPDRAVHDHIRAAAQEQNCRLRRMVRPLLRNDQIHVQRTRRHIVPGGTVGVDDAVDPGERLMVERDLQMLFHG